MSETTKIEWADATFNPWIGCTKVSPGCANCYAEVSVPSRVHKINWGKGQLRRRASPANWKLPVRWNAGGRNAAAPMRVFPSLCDWLDEEVPIEWLADFLKLIHGTPNLDWLLLTKRPEQFQPRLEELCRQPRPHRPEWSFAAAMMEFWRLGDAPLNVWVGASVEDQRRADERIPELLKIPARVRFLSVEPLLGPVDLRLAIGGLNGLDWVIVGGESGTKARPCNVEWIRSVITQCQLAVLPVFVKQLGSAPYEHPFHVELERLATASIKHSKGGDPSEWPEDLRVREFPEIRNPQPTIV